VTRLEKPARDKHSSSLRKLVKYGQKRFYYIGPWLKKVFTEYNTLTYCQIFNYHIRFIVLAQG
jgi:hypothetical protein